MKQRRPAQFCAAGAIRGSIALRAKTKAEHLCFIVSLCEIFLFRRLALALSRAWLALRAHAAVAEGFENARPNRIEALLLGHLQPKTVLDVEDVHRALAIGR